MNLKYTSANSVEPDQTEHTFSLYITRKYGVNITYQIYQKYSDRQIWANRVDADEMPQNAVPHQDLHCLPLIQQLLDTTTGNKLYLFKFQSKCGKEMRRLNT